MRERPEILDMGQIALRELRQRPDLVQGWDPEAVYERGALCTFNGSIYAALQVTAAGQPPPIDPSWRLAVRGFSELEIWRPGTYYAGQIVSYGGGTWLCTAPSTAYPPGGPGWAQLAAPGAGGGGGGYVLTPGAVDAVAPWAVWARPVPPDPRDEEFDGDLSAWTLLGTATNGTIDRAADATWGGGGLTSGVWTYQLAHSRLWIQAARDPASGAAMYAIRKTVNIGTNDLVYGRIGGDWIQTADGDGTLLVEVGADDSNNAAISISSNSGTWRANGYVLNSGSVTPAGTPQIGSAALFGTNPIRVLGIRRTGTTYTFFVGDDHGNLNVIGATTMNAAPSRLTIGVANRTAYLPVWIDFLRWVPGGQWPIFPLLPGV